MRKYKILRDQMAANKTLPLWVEVKSKVFAEI
jgi:hypothetical protein